MSDHDPEEDVTEEDLDFFANDEAEEEEFISESDHFSEPTSEAGTDSEMISVSDLSDEEVVYEEETENDADALPPLNPIDEEIIETPVSEEEEFYEEDSHEEIAYVEDLDEYEEQLEEEDDDGFATALGLNEGDRGPDGGAIPLPPPRDPLEVKRERALRRRRLWKVVKFCLFTLLIFLIVAVIGGIGAYFYAMPRYELAQKLKMKRLDDLEVASKILDRNGRELARIYVQNRQPVELKDVSDNFVKAILAAEDSRFYEHDGVDYRGVLRAVVQNFKAGEMSQGASTITQQLARNAFDLREKSISRKVTEAFLARRIEEEIGSKDLILQHYINRIYFGDGYYGIAAAAEGYFGRKADDLTHAQAATLAGVIRNPYFRGPRKFPKASKDTRDGVLKNMKRFGYITKNEYEAALAEELVTIPKRSQSGRSKYVYDRVRQQVVDLIGKETAAGGGYIIKTTIDMDIQQQAESRLQEQLSLVEQHPEYKHQTLADYKELKKNFSETAAEGSRPPAPTYLQGSLLMIDNETGAIIALVGGRDFSDSMFDRTAQGRRPLGTAFLPFVYASAFEGGAFPGSLVEDVPMDQKFLQVGGMQGIVAEWGPEDASNTYEDKITYRRALSKSAIASTLRVGMRSGREDVIDLAKAAGLTFEGDLQRFNASFLGRNPASMTDLCLAYSIFPNKGYRPESTFLIESIVDENGAEIFRPQVSRTSRPCIDEYTAFQISSCLEDSLHTGSAKKATKEYNLGDFPVAGKTGTEYGFTDNWFVGFTSKVTCAVWAGFDQSKEIYPLAFSSDTVLPVWTDVMNASAKRFQPDPFMPPSDAQRAEICTHSGELATNDCYEIIEEDGAAKQVRTTYVEYFRPGTDIQSKCPIHGGPDSKVLTETTRLTFTDKVRQSTAIRAILPGAGASEPVIPVALSVLGEDPYNSYAPVIQKKRIIPEELPNALDDDDQTEGDEPIAIRAVPLGMVGEDEGRGGGDDEGGEVVEPVARERREDHGVPDLSEDPSKPVEGRVRLAPPAPIQVD